MKTNFRLFTLSLVALTVFAACSKEDPNTNANGTKNVYITISDENVTRAGSNPVTDQTTVTFTDGSIFFINGNSGRIDKVLDIKSGSDADKQDETFVGADLLKGGVTIKNVPSSVTEIQILANVASTVKLPVTGENRSNLEAVLIPIQTQYNSTNGGVDKVTLYGKSTSYTDDTTGNVDIRKFDKFMLNAISARLQLGAIEQTGDIITNYQIDGIFINNYYETMRINGSAGALVDNGVADAAEAAIVYKSGSAAYGSALAGIVYDYRTNDTPGNGLGVSNGGKGYIPDGSNTVWAYNLPALATNSASPYIIIRINEIETIQAAVDYVGPWYLTAKLVNSSGEELSIKAGTIYNISKIQFELGDLKEVPNPEDFEVTVEIELMTWTVAETDYQLQ